MQVDIRLFTFSHSLCRYHFDLVPTFISFYFQYFIVLRFLREFDDLVTTKYRSSITVCSFKMGHKELLLKAIDDDFYEFEYIQTSLRDCLD